MHGRSIAARAVLLEAVRERVVGPAVARARMRRRVGARRGRGSPCTRGRPCRRVARSGGDRCGRGRGGAARCLRRLSAPPRRGRRCRSRPADRLDGERPGGLAGLVDAARRRAEQGERALRDEEAALLRGHGARARTQRLDESVRDDFERSGLAHILAVSGQNVMLLATLVLAAGAVSGSACALGSCLHSLWWPSTCRSQARDRRSSAPG